MKVIARFRRNGEFVTPSESDLAELATRYVKALVQAELSDHEVVVREAAKDTPKIA